MGKRHRPRDRHRLQAIRDRARQRNLDWMSRSERAHEVVARLRFHAPHRDVLAGRACATTAADPDRQPTAAERRRPKTRRCPSRRRRITRAPRSLRPPRCARRRTAARPLRRAAPHARARSRGDPRAPGRTARCSRRSPASRRASPGARPSASRSSPRRCPATAPRAPHPARDSRSKMQPHRAVRSPTSELAASNPIVRAAELEGAHPLQVLALEEHLRADPRVERARRDDRRPVRHTGEPFRRAGDVGEGYGRRAPGRVRSCCTRNVRGR